MGLNNPVDESGPYSFHYPFLFLHIIGVDAPYSLLLKHVALYRGAILRHVVDI